MEILKIPKKRLGKLRESKEKIEKKCNVSLEFEEAEVTITGEPSDVFFAKDVVKAVGRGFEPNIALKIYTSNFQFHLINLKEYAKNNNGVSRIKARIIGEKGKIKKEIEDATESYLSIYGTSVGIISKIDTIQYAIEAVDIVLNGSKFSTLFKYLSIIKEKIFAERLLS